VRVSIKKEPQVGQNNVHGDDVKNPAGSEIGVCEGAASPSPLTAPASAPETPESKQSPLAGVMTYAAWAQANSKPKLWAHVEPYLDGLAVLRPRPDFTHCSATPCEGKIFIAPVVGIITLVTAFHEIGHIKTWNLVVEDVMWHEEAAWGWARKKCPLWDKRAQKFAFYCLRSYEHGDSVIGRMAEHEYTRPLVNELIDAGFPPDVVGPIPPRPKPSRRSFKDLSVSARRPFRDRENL
jgi:hypothetical protein